MKIFTDQKYYRWLICFACTLALFCTGGLTITGFTVYVPYIIKEGGLNNSQMSAVLLVRNFFTLLSMFMVVRYIRKLDIRVGLALSVLGVALSFLVYGLAVNFFTYCLAAALSGFFYGLGGMVSVSVIIQRWFTEHEGLALGICASGTGLSAVFGTPVITREIEALSMKSTFLLEAVFVVLIAILVFLFVKNYPSKEKEEAVHEARIHKIQLKSGAKLYKLNTTQKILALTGVFLTGASFNASSFLTVLLREKNFDAVTVAWFISFMGISLCFGKCIYGFAVDKLGRYYAGNLFHACFILGIAVAGLCPSENSMLALTAMLLLGIGFPMLSVGLSELAEGTAYAEYYADVVRQYQITYMAGSLCFGIFPGILADLTGSYVSSYVIMTVIALAAAILQQRILRKENA